MYTLLQIELFKIFRQPRTYIAFAAIAAIVLLIQLALYVDGEKWLAFGMQPLTASFTIEGKILNGYLVCFIVLQTLLIWMGVLSLLLSVIMFGTGDLIILKSEEVVILEKTDVLWRYFAAFGFAALAMTTVAALAFLLSVLAENAIGLIVATMSVVIVYTILSTMDIPLFNTIKPWIFTSHMIGWKGFFDNPIHAHAITKSAMILLTHIFIFVGAAIFIFRRKDLLS